jgi:hypothetical protein
MQTHTAHEAWASLVASDTKRREGLVRIDGTGYHTRIAEA